MNKSCTKCGTPKNLEEFPKRSAAKDGRESWCRACVKARNDAYYAAQRPSILAQKQGYWDANKETVKPKNRARWAANRVRYAAANKRWAEAHRAEVLAYLRQRGADHRAFTDALKEAPCLDCGKVFPPFVMEFDHVRGSKRYALGKMSNHSSAAIAAELAKCELVCCACHRVRSDDRRKESTNQRLLDFRAWLASMKDRPCVDCGAKFPRVAMDFDHVRGVKLTQISDMWSWGRDKVLAEIAKCELVCANCHRVRTHIRDEDEEMVA